MTPDLAQQLYDDVRRAQVLIGAEGCAPALPVLDEIGWVLVDHGARPRDLPPGVADLESAGDRHRARVAEAQLRAVDLDARERERRADRRELAGVAA